MASSDYKKFNREIKAYVEISYDIKLLKENDSVICYYYNTAGRTNQLTPYQYGRRFNEIINADFYIPEYAILYQDYTKLNGNQLLFNKNNNYCGFISQETPSSLETLDERNVIFEANLQDGLSGITFYFRDNTIKNARVNLYKENETTPVVKEIINNTNDNLFIDTSDDKYTHIIVETLEWTMPDRPIWILRIDLGLTHIYQNEEIIEMNITEEVNKLMLETPNNEFTMTIGDYEKLYDPLNPKGISKFLKEDITQFIPYIGIVSETGEVEYTKMGTFYFDKIDYNEKEVTFTAYNLMAKLNKINITNESGELTYNDTAIIPINNLKAYLDHYIEYEYGEYFDKLNSQHYFDIQNKIRMWTKGLKIKTLAQFLQDAVMIDGIFYINRNNDLIIKNIDKYITETISKTELLKDLNYSNVPKLTAFNLERNSISISEGETNTEALYSQTFTLEQPYQVFTIELNEPTVLYNIHQTNIRVTGASSYNLIKKGTYNNFFYVIFIGVNGEVGNEITISITPTTKRVYNTSNEVEIIGDGEPQYTINNPLYMQKYYLYDDKFTNFFDKAYSYKVNFDYNGNAEIKAGDYIEVETNYGTIPLFVEKHTLKYKGGLSGSIEGVE